MGRKFNYFIVAFILIFLIIMETSLLDSLPPIVIIREKINSTFLKPETQPPPATDLISQKADIFDFTGTNFNVLPQLTLFKSKTVYVIDGDTIIFDLNGHEIKTRLLGLDTPELETPEESEQPFAQTAKDFVADFLANSTTIYLALETGSPLDKYDRLLVYVFNEKLELLQYHLLKQGLARSLNYWQQPLIYHSLFQQLESDAQVAKLNIWSLPNYVTETGFTPPLQKK